MLTADRSIPGTARQPGAPWSLRAAAAFLQISPRHMARLVAAETIKSFKISRRVFIADAELRRIAEQGTDPR